MLFLANLLRHPMTVALGAVTLAAALAAGGWYVQTQRLRAVRADVATLHSTIAAYERVFAAAEKAAHARAAEADRLRRELAAAQSRLNAAAAANPAWAGESVPAEVLDALRP